MRSRVSYPSPTNCHPYCSHLYVHLLLSLSFLLVPNFISLKINNCGDIMGNLNISSCELFTRDRYKTLNKWGPLKIYRTMCKAFQPLSWYELVMRKFHMRGSIPSTCRHQDSLSPWWRSLELRSQNSSNAIFLCFLSLFHFELGENKKKIKFAYKTWHLMTAFISY